MIKVIGNDPKFLKQITCSNCTSILQYAPCDVENLRYTDEGRDAMGIICPQCNKVLRTNP